MHNDETTATLNHKSVFSFSDVVSGSCFKFFDEILCREWVLHQLHPSGAFCPECGFPVHPRFEGRFWEGKRIKCHCGKFYTALTGTFLSGCQLKFSEVILLAILLCPDITYKTIADVLDMSPANVRLWRNKFEAMEKIKNG